MLLRSLHIASRQLFYLLVIGVVLSLIGLMAAVWISDEISKRKDDIAVWVSEQTGYPVEIGSAGLYWYDFIPKLQVSQVALLQKKLSTPIATADEIYLSLDILATLSQREPVVAHASIKGVDIAIERGSEGQFRLTGLEVRENHFQTVSLTEALRWLSWLKRLNLDSIQIDYQDALKAQWSGLYSVHQADIRFADLSWQGNAVLGLPEQLGEQLKLAAQAEINSDYTIKAWHGRLQSDTLAFATVLEGEALQGAVLQQGHGSVLLEASHGIKDELEIALSLAMHDGVVSSTLVNEAIAPLTVNRLQGRLKFQKQADAWRLYGENLQMQIAGQAWPLTQFAVERDVSGQLTTQADYLRLSDITSLALLLDGMPEIITVAQPAGDIFGLNASYSPQQGLQALRFEASEIAMLPWQQYPGANGLSFSLDWTQAKAKLDFNSHKTTLYVDDWLEQAVYLESLTGQLEWQNEAEQWQAKADSLRVWNEDLGLQLDGMIRRQNAVTDIDAILSLQDVVVNRWQQYVPQRILPQQFKRWADTAFLDGIIRTGKIAMKGNPSAFPFDTSPEQGSFDMQLQVENTQLHYASGWPDIINVNGSISGQGNNLLIKSQSGKIAGFEFKDVTTTISNLVRPKPVLQVAGGLTGTTAQAMAFLQNSPLKKRFGSIPDWLQMNGNSDIQLDLMVPLVEPDHTEAKGYVTFADSVLTTKAIPSLKVTAINGQLDFSNNGVTADNITAIAFAEPVRIDVVPEKNSTVVKVDGKASTTALNKVWAGVVPDFVSGETAYLTRIMVREPKAGDFSVDVGVKTRLQGITIDAPAPVGKTAQQSKALDINLQQHGEELTYQVELDDWLSAAFSVSENRPRGQIILGGGTATKQGDGLTVSGQLDTLNIEQWLDWQAQQPQTDTSLASQLKQIDLSLGTLQLAKQQIEQLKLTAKRSDNGWKVGLNSAKVRGGLLLPDKLNDEQPLDIQFAYLKLALPKSETKSAQAQQSKTLWPSMRVNIEEFSIEDMPLGQLQLQGVHSASQWQLKSATLKSDVMTASATGNWSRDASGDHSQLEITISSEDVKALLAHFGYQQVIEARQAQLIGQLHWQDEPTAFSFQNLNGSLDLKVGRGSLIEVEPGAAGRIFGLLSIAAIPRRLALDFSDLFGKGFDFSSIKGRFKLDDGIASTDDLTMQGDSALIEVMGPIDIVNKTYDQTVRITPKVSSTLPLAGAVAGGPVGLGVGTAILLFDKLAGTIFDREIVNLITYNYRLTGPWDDPELHIANPPAN